MQKIKQKELWSNMTEEEKEKVREERFNKHRSDADVQTRKLRVEKRRTLAALTPEEKAKYDKEVKY
jgi:hypothetical protein